MSNGDSDWEYEYDDSQVEEFYITVDIQAPRPLKRPWNPEDIFANYQPSAQPARKRPRRSRQELQHAALTTAGASEAVTNADPAGPADTADAAYTTDAAQPAEADNAIESPDAADSPPAASPPLAPHIPTVVDTPTPIEGPNGHVNWPYIYPRRARRVRNLATGELELPRAPRGFELPNSDEDDDGGSATDDNDNDDDEDDDEDAEPEEEQPDESDGEDAEDAEGWKLQLLDPASARPLISHRGKLYACHWATPLGTDLYFVRRKDLEPDDDDDDQGGEDAEADEADTSPARGEADRGARKRDGTSDAVRGEWALLGTSAARLVAEPADIEFRARPVPHTNEARAAEERRARLVQEEGGERPFFERFVELKARRGEIVPPRILKLWGPDGMSKAERKPRAVPDGAGAEEEQAQEGAMDRAAVAEAASRLGLPSGGDSRGETELRFIVVDHGGLGPVADTSGG